MPGGGQGEHNSSAGAMTVALFERHRARVHAHCARRLGDDEAADAVQDTFLRAWLAIRGGAEVRHPLPWLLTIADNVCVSRFRARGARVVTTELRDDTAYARSVAPPELETLSAAFRELPDTQRHALLRRELQGYSYDEIGDELGVSRASVAALVHRARRAVAERLHAARRGVHGLFPLPTVVWSFVTSGGGGAAAVGSTAAVAVAVVQLAGPAPSVAQEPAATGRSPLVVTAARVPTALATSPRTVPASTARPSGTGLRRISERPASPRKYADDVAAQSPVPERPWPTDVPEPLPPTPGSDDDTVPSGEPPSPASPESAPAEPAAPDPPDGGNGTTEGEPAADDVPSGAPEHGVTEPGTEPVSEQGQGTGNGPDSIEGQAQRSSEERGRGHEQAQEHGQGKGQGKQEQEPGQPGQARGHEPGEAENAGLDETPE